MDSLAQFTVQRPTSIAEAAALLAGHKGARILAGGTDLLPNLRRGIGAPELLIDVSRVAGFTALEDAGGSLAIGGGVTLAALCRDPRVAAHWPGVAQAAAGVAGPSHREAATVGGNLCLDTRCVFYNQSEWWRAANGFCLKHRGEVCHVAPQGRRCHAAFSGDLAPALLVCGAVVELTGSATTRMLPLAELYRDDGAAHLALARDEVLAAVHLPRPAEGLRSGYRKARARGAIDFPLAGVAVSLQLDGERLASLAVALTGTNPRPLLVDGTRALLGGRVDASVLASLAKLVQKQSAPMRTTVTASNYRRQVAAALAQRLVRELADTTGATGASARTPGDA